MCRGSLIPQDILENQSIWAWGSPHGSKGQAALTATVTVQPEAEAETQVFSMTLQLTSDLYDLNVCKRGANTQTGVLLFRHVNKLMRSLILGCYKKKGEMEFYDLMSKLKVSPLCFSVWQNRNIHPPIFSRLWKQVQTRWPIPTSPIPHSPAGHSLQIHVNLIGKLSWPLK